MHHADEPSSFPETRPFDALLSGIAELRSHTEGDPEICIALLDGPVDPSHPCFAGARLTPVDTITPACATSGLATRHGTHVASILFGQPGSPLHGIAPRCRGLLLPIFSDLRDGRGVRAAMQLDLARAILQAVALGAHVINVSGGELVASAQADPYLTNAVRLCAESGVILVAAAGNDACDCLHVPAALNGTLVVGAMGRDGDPMPQSNYSDVYATRGVLAPGERIAGADLGGGIVERSGTSFAAALVSGVAALLLSEQVQRTGRRDGRAVVDAILASAQPCQPKDDCRRLFRGRLDVARARTILMRGGTIHMNEQEITAPNPLASGELPGGIAPSAIASTPPQYGEGVLPSCGGDKSCGCDGGGDKSEKKECSCKKEPEKKGGCGSKPVLAYALGRIGYDFGTEAKRDSFVQSGVRHPYDARELLDYLDRNPWASTDVIFTLEQDSTPIYAVTGGGPYGVHIFERIREVLRDQLEGNSDTVSLPAWVGGNATLANGQTLPVLWPNARGIYNWTRGALLESLVGSNVSNDDERVGAISNFLDRVSFELRNLGVDPRERALNFAATNAFQVARVYESAIRASLVLDTISVERSPICRPNSDCWDVSLTFFDPNQRLTRSRRIYRFTVDVSDVLPVTIGGVRSFDVF